jgi:hypothetical protein
VLARELADRQAQTIAMINLGELALLDGDLTSATEPVTGALPLALPLGDPRVLTTFIEYVARLLVAQGKHVAALGLAGWADGERQRTGFARDSAATPDSEGYVDARCDICRARLWS